MTKKQHVVLGNQRHHIISFDLKDEESDAYGKISDKLESMGASKATRNLWVLPDNESTTGDIWGSLRGLISGDGNSVFIAVSHNDISDWIIINPIDDISPVNPFGDINPINITE